MISINFIAICVAKYGNELIIVGGKCGPRLVMKTNKKKKGQNILLIGPECKEIKKEEEVKYIPVPMPMHMMHDMHGMGGMGGWRRKR